LSFSGGSGRSFGGGKKGFSPSQKKEKKKKQEFHKHRVKFTSEEHLDFEQLKNRLSIGLDRLGNQIFSTEPGGYDFSHWMGSFNLLLDDFEEKAPSENLPKEYFDSRQRLTAKLLAPVDFSSIDTEIKSLEAQISSTQEKISDIARRAELEKIQERHDSASRIDELKKERVESDMELNKARTLLEEQKKAEAKKSVFGKMFSRSGPSSSKATQSKIDSLTAQKKQIDRDLESLLAERAKKQSSKKNRSEEITSLQAELESQQQALGELQAQKQEKMQLSEKRKEITKSLVQVISGIQLQSEPPQADEENKSDFVPLN